MTGPSGQHRTALVTGSSNGIGAALVRRLAQLDFKLVVTGRSADDVRRVADECARESPARLRPLEVVAELELEADVERLFESAMDHFDGRLDLLVNNAGFSKLLDPQATPGQQYANFKRTLQVNTSSAVYLTLLASEPLRQTARSSGASTSVVNVSSVAAIRPLADFAYCASKAALNMFASCMAAELGPEVRVNSVLPGPIETKIIERSGQSLDNFKAASELMSPTRRIGQPPEVVEAVVYLSDPERASYVSGAQLLVDGAITCAQMRF